MFQLIGRGDRERAAARRLDAIAASDTIEFTTAPQPARPADIVPERLVRPAPARGFRLSDGPITLDGGEDLFGFSAFTVQIDFCREEAGDNGALVTFDGSFALALQGETLVGTVETTLGRRVLKAAAPGVGWHRATLAFDGGAGRAALWLDDRQVASADDLAGAEQAGNFFAELQIGAAGGDGFTGLLDNFRLLDAALDSVEKPAP